MEPDDIDLGAQPVRVRRPKRCGVVIAARFTSEDADALGALAAQRAIGLSQLVRQIVRDYLAKPSASFQYEPSTTGNAVNTR